MTTRHHTVPLRFLPLLLAALATVACNDEIVGPKPRVTLSIEKATPSGDRQTDTVLATLHSPLRVVVKRGTVPVQGISVQWSVGPDTASPGIATTSDAAGIASYQRTLGSTAGEYTVRASVAGATGSPLTFTATATPGHPTALRIVSGNDQVDTLKARLAADYLVQVTDGHANGVGGVTIDWAVTAGGGSITPTRSTTQESTGQAAARHTLGPDPGPQTVTASATALTDVAPVAFTAALYGALRITTATTGAAFAPDGYRASAHATTADINALVPVNGTLTMSRVRPGDYAVTLSGVSVNCDVADPASQAVTVSGGETAAAAFAVACAAPTQLAFASTAGGNQDIYRVNANGTLATQLTTNPAADGDPAWSPDGSKLAFTSWRDGNAEIYVMNADGSGALRLTDTTAADSYPTWAPHGAAIAFVSDRTGRPEIFVMHADGSSPVLLTNFAGGRDPAWSPDGTKIAFSSDRQGGSSIFVMNADGTGATRLTSGYTDGEPAWSPDGTRLAFARIASCDYYGYYCERDVFVMNADGTGVTALLIGAEDDGHPAWSGDGRWIAFAAALCDYYYGCYQSGIRATQLGGARVEDVTLGWALSPAWRP